MPVQTRPANGINHYKQRVRPKKVSVFFSSYKREQPMESILICWEYRQDDWFLISKALAQPQAVTGGWSRGLERGIQTKEPMKILVPGSCQTASGLNANQWLFAKTVARDRWFQTKQPMKILVSCSCKAQRPIESIVLCAKEEGLKAKGLIRGHRVSMRGAE